MGDDKAVVDALLDRHGRTYSEEIGFDPGRDKPSELFRLLVASLLFSARISADIAVRAAKALAEQGWTTADKLADSTWQERTRVLNESGYARYDERTSSMLGETTDLVIERWKGDLRNLREEAERDPEGERRLLKRCKGIGDAGADIFLREVQGAWDEVYPFVDRRAQAGARALGLPERADKLAGLVDRADFARLTAALIRADQAGDAEEIAAAGRA